MISPDSQAEEKTKVLTKWISMFPSGIKAVWPGFNGISCSRGNNELTSWLTVGLACWPLLSWLRVFARVMATDSFVLVVFRGTQKFLCTGGGESPAKTDH